MNIFRISIRISIDINFIDCTNCDFIHTISFSWHILTSISQSSASTSPSASASTSTSAPASPSVTASSSAPTSPRSEDTVGVALGFPDGLLLPYMGLLPIAQPNDPWNQKAYNPYYALHNVGGSYEAYLRPRRDTHIMPSNHQMLTPDMLQRLLRIKIEFQRRFPHLYQGMIDHQTNQTRVVVIPPLLVRNVNRIKQDNDGPVYELNAAERNVLTDDNLGGAQVIEQASSIGSSEMNTDRTESNSDKRTKKSDDDLNDYFHFDEDDENKDVKDVTDVKDTDMFDD